MVSPRDTRSERFGAYARSRASRHLAACASDDQSAQRRVGLSATPALPLFSARLARGAVLGSTGPTTRSRYKAPSAAPRWAADAKLGAAAAAYLQR